MGQVIYSMGTSVDGYAEDAGGAYDWSAPEDDIHAIANAQLRETAAMVSGRRMHEEMDVWTRIAGEAGHPAVMAEFAEAFVRTPRYVVSDTLRELPGVAVVPRAEGADLVRRLRDSTDGLVEVSGPTFAGSVLHLVDEFRMWVNPVAVGGGKPFFPQLPEPLPLWLAECREFPSGALYLRYRRA